VDDVLLILTPGDVLATLARRVRAARKARRWTQADLARRSGLSVATVARFEQSGHGQVASLIALCSALGRLEDFDAVLAAQPPATMEDLRRLQAKR